MNDGDATNRDPKPSAQSTPRWQFGLRDVFYVTTIVAVYLTLYASILRVLWQSDSFRSSLIMGAIVGGMQIIRLFIQITRAKRGSGEVLIRLDHPISKRNRWMAIWVMPLLAVVLLSVTLLSRNWSIISDASPYRSPFLIGYVLVLLSTRHGLLVVESFCLNSLKLCQRGLIIDSTEFVPWGSVSAWDMLFDDKDFLIVRVGRKRMNVYVEPDSRAEVEALVRKKVS
jgi:hypothetical protein